MSSCLKALTSPTAQNILLGTVFTLNAVSLGVQVYNDTTWQKVADVFAANCHVNETAEYTCKELFQMVSEQSNVSFALNYILSPVTLSLSLLNIFSRCKSSCASKRKYEQVGSLASIPESD